MHRCDISDAGGNETKKLYEKNECTDHYSFSLYPKKTIYRNGMDFVNHLFP